MDGWDQDGRPTPTPAGDDREALAQDALDAWVLAPKFAGEYQRRQAAAWAFEAGYLAARPSAPPVTTERVLAACERISFHMDDALEVLAALGIEVQP